MFHGTHLIWSYRGIIIEGDGYFLPLEFSQLLKVKSETMNIVLQQLSHLAWSPLVTTGRISSSHVFVIMDVLSLDGDLSLVLSRLKLQPIIATRLIWEHLLYNHKLGNHTIITT
jgi:hypothetical protein